MSQADRDAQRDRHPRRLTSRRCRWGAGEEAEQQWAQAPEGRATWQALGVRVASQRPGTLRWRRRFGGTAEQVGDARRFARFLLADSSLAGDAAWITGELATNALRHLRSGRAGGTFIVEVLRWRRYAEIRLIDDGGDGEPRVVAVDPVEVATAAGEELPESGLGLYGIGAMAFRYGTYRHSDGRRVVWVRLNGEPTHADRVRP